MLSYLDPLTSGIDEIGADSSKSNTAAENRRVS